ncbi:MAG: GNAT family N-acetyltransferase [Novosphingobium sp.]|nr:GNAT family N-acetyltransferase [Novosphingobium sp.]
MFIRSERLFLRPGWPEDWEELHALIGDEAVVRNLARAPWPYSPEHARSFLAQPREGRLPRFLITLPGAKGARLVGCVGLTRGEAGAGAPAELGYWIARPCWGQGYATEAASAVIGLARTLGHRQLVANHFADNPASGRVLAKLGFRPTGEVRPRYSLGRGGEAPALAYERALGGPCDCDDEPCDDAMREVA